MARQILPIAGASVSGHYGDRPSWWRRALLKMGLACLRWAGRPDPMNGYAGSPVMGKAIDPTRIDVDWKQPRDTFVISGAASTRTLDRLTIKQARGSR